MNNTSAHTSKTQASRTSNISIPDFSEKVNSETKFSKKSSPDTVTMSKGEAQKRKANFESDKVFSKAEVEKAIGNTSGLSHVATKVRNELINEVWRGLNSNFSDSKRKKYLNMMSDKIFCTVMQESGDAYDNTSREEIAAVEREIVEALKKVEKEAGAPSTRAKLEAEFNASDAGYWKNLARFGRGFLRNLY